MDETRGNDNRQRIVNEILGDCLLYAEGEGPEGPWYYGALRIVRIMNTIFIHDVDGNYVGHHEIEELNDSRVNTKKLLREILENENDKVHNEL